MLITSHHKEHWGNNYVLTNVFDDIKNYSNILTTVQTQTLALLTVNALMIIDFSYFKLLITILYF